MAPTLFLGVKVNNANFSHTSANSTNRKAWVTSLPWVEYTEDISKTDKVLLKKERWIKPNVTRHHGKSWQLVCELYPSVLLKYRPNNGPSFKRANARLYSKALAVSHLALADSCEDQGRMAHLSSLKFCFYSLFTWEGYRDGWTVASMRHAMVLQDYLDSGQWYHSIHLLQVGSKPHTIYDSNPLPSHVNMHGRSTSWPGPLRRGRRKGLGTRLLLIWKCHHNHHQ